MVIVETDLILALASRRDRHHSEAVKVVKSVKPLRLSPYALIELDLLILSGRLKAKIPLFYKALAKTLSYYSIDIVKPSPQHMAKAWKLREKYRLTYFDSLHASTAIAENDILVSYDKTYLGVEELRYLTPREILESSSNRSNP